LADVRFQQVSKTYPPRPSAGRRQTGVSVLQNLDLSIDDGEFLVLVGPSGCGKSTLLRLLAGLSAPAAGQVDVGGRPVSRLRPAARDVAMVFQSYALYPYMTVRENIAMPLAMRRLDRVQRLPLLGRWWPGARTARREIDQAVQAAAEPLGLQALLERRPAQLSGGQRQRVALARAFLKDAPVLLLDEATSALDTDTERAIQASLAELMRGRTTLIVAHRFSTIRDVDRVVVLDQGAIVADGPRERVYAENALFRRLWDQQSAGSA